MIRDIRVVLWKEWREILHLRGGLRGTVIVSVLPLAVLGILLPWQMGAAWIQGFTPLAFWIWIPPLMISATIADSFAGERERHTLETLLASRLPDRAILLGKTAASVLYGWAMGTAIPILGLLTVNLISFTQGGAAIFYPPGRILAGLILSLLSAGLGASAGVLISLRAATVRQAQQTLSVALLLIVLVPVIGPRLLPVRLRNALDQALSGTDPLRLLLALAVLLGAVDLALMGAAAARFRRSRLILD